MAITTLSPGVSKRIQLSDGATRRSTVYVIFSAKCAADIYVVPRMLGGAVKVSLHQSGSWQVGETNESFARSISGGSRHWEIWRRGTDIGPGVTRAWYLTIPDTELRAGVADPKAYQLPPVGAGHAASLEILLLSATGPDPVFDDAHIVAKLELKGRAESCLVLARRIPWSTEQQIWASTLRKAAFDQAAAAGIPTRSDHRYFFHGHDAQGVRFGLELAPT